MAARAVLLSYASLAAANDAGSGKELISAADPQKVVAALQQAGFTAELRSDPNGPSIASTAEGFGFLILFTDCTQGQNCASLQFHALFAAADVHTPEYANAFNVRYRYLQASALPNKQLRLAYDLNTRGGITKENFSAIVESWSEALRLYAGYARE